MVSAKTQPNLSPTGKAEIWCTLTLSHYFERNSGCPVRGKKTNQPYPARFLKIQAATLRQRLQLSHLRFSDWDEKCFDWIPWLQLEGQLEGLAAHGA